MVVIGEVVIFFLTKSSAKLEFFEAQFFRHGIVRKIHSSSNTQKTNSRSANAILLVENQTPVKVIEIHLYLVFMFT